MFPNESLQPTGEWLVPIVLAVWFVRTLSAMAAAQREIVQRLGDIEAYLRSSTTRPVT